MEPSEGLLHIDELLLQAGCSARVISRRKEGQMVD